MNAVEAFLLYLFGWLLGIARFALGIIRSLAMLATLGLSAYWWWTARPDLVRWIAIAFAVCFAAFVLRYATYSLEARLRRSVRVPYRYNW